MAIFNIARRIRSGVCDVPSAMESTIARNIMLNISSITAEVMMSLPVGVSRLKIVPTAIPETKYDPGHQFPYKGWMFHSYKNLAEDFCKYKDNKDRYYDFHRCLDIYNLIIY